MALVSEPSNTAKRSASIGKYLSLRISSFVLLLASAVFLIFAGGACGSQPDPVADSTVEVSQSSDGRLQLHVSDPRLNDVRFLELLKGREFEKISVVGLPKGLTDVGLSGIESQRSLKELFLGDLNSVTGVGLLAAVRANELEILTLVNVAGSNEFLNIRSASLKRLTVIVKEIGDPVRQLQLLSEQCPNLEYLYLRTKWEGSAFSDEVALTSAVSSFGALTHFVISGLSPEIVSRLESHLVENVPGVRVVLEQ